MPPWGDTLGDTIYVLGDVVVPEGCTLTIDQGAVVKFLTNDREDFGVDSTKCEIIVKGALVVNGTENDSVWFVSCSDSPSDSDWYGIRVDSSGTAKLSYCNIEHAYTAICYANSANDSVSHCRFRNNYMYAIRTQNSNVLVDECIIEKDWTGLDSSEGYGVVCDSCGSTIKNTSFEGLKYGIKVIGSEETSISPLIEECGFYNIGEIGIWATSDSDPTIKKCCFKGSYGQTCIKVEGGDPYIKQCYMASQGDSIPIGMVFVNGATGRIRKTTIWDYRTCAVQILNNATNPDFGNSDSIGCNWFGEPSRRFYFISFSDSTILAKCNYWDVDDGDTSGIRAKIVGNVDIDTILGRCDRCDPYYSDQCSDLPPSDPYFLSCPNPKIAVTQEDEKKEEEKEEEKEKIPEVFSLSQNYPNPFNPQTLIKYNLPQTGYVNLTIYNIIGQKVRTLADELQDPGYKTLFWDGKDDAGKEVASGIYFFRLKAGDFEAVKRMILLR